MAKKKSKRDVYPSYSPKPIGKTAWYYEENNGLSIVHEHGAVVLLPWTKIEVARKRYLAKRRARRADL